MSLVYIRREGTWGGCVHPLFNLRFSVIGEGNPEGMAKLPEVAYLWKGLKNNKEPAWLSDANVISDTKL